MHQATSLYIVWLRDSGSSPHVGQLVWLRSVCGIHLCEPCWCHTEFKVFHPLDRSGGLLLTHATLTHASTVSPLVPIWSLAQQCALQLSVTGISHFPWCKFPSNMLSYIVVMFLKHSCTFFDTLSFAMECLYSYSLNLGRCVATLMTRLWLKYGYVAPEARL